VAMILLDRSGDDVKITTQQRLSGNSPPKKEAFAAAFGGEFPITVL